MTATAIWQEIGDRVWVRRYAFIDQTIGVVGGADGLLVIDTRSSHRDAAELKSDIRLLGPVVGWAVNTHRHWDHTFGNALFPETELWGHERCVTGMLEFGETERAEIIEDYPDRTAEWNEVVITPPRSTFTEHAAIDIGGRTVDLRYLGRGHTDGDIVVVVPDAGVLFAGDLLENGSPPWFGDGYPLDWPATAEGILALTTGPVAAGHGEVGDRVFVERQLEELREIANLGRAVAAGDLSLETAVARAPYKQGASRAAIRRAAAQARGEID
jgi:glyoxylase-like metal-dependent hydrolase (beta-lactamase superfamily II)